VRLENAAKRSFVGGAGRAAQYASQAAPPSSSPANEPKGLADTREKDARQDKGSKLAASLAALLASAPDPKRTVEVEIWLHDVRPDILESLKKLGFVQTAEPKVAKIRRGRIALGQIAALERLADVDKVRLLA
jgi:hypothetical protein